MSPPPVTFVVTVYQQERWVRAALQGALDQTYRPLEVLVLDDASTDRTPDIIEDMIRGYKGPHSVRFIRNEQNVGTRPQFNRAAREAQGQLLVHGAGDDISHADRAEKIAALWVEAGAHALASNASIIDADDAEIGTFLPEGYQPWASWQEMATASGGSPGCTIAWDRRIYDVFGDVPGFAVEDAVTFMRALLLGRMAYHPERLLSYRRHGRNYGPWANERPRKAWNDYLFWTEGYARERSALCRAWLDDIALYLSKHPDGLPGSDETLKRLRGEIELFEVRGRLCRGKANRLHDLRTLWRVREDVLPRALVPTAAWLLWPAAYRQVRAIVDGLR